MPRFENDPTKTVASFEVLPKDDYEFIIGEPKSFFRVNNKGGDSYGVQWPLTTADTGKRVIFSTYQQSEGAKAMEKQFLLAVLGYGKDRSEEKRFDLDHAGIDYSIDTDTKSVGDGYRELVGMRVIGSLDTRMGDNNQEQQQFVGWRNISAA